MNLDVKQLYGVAQLQGYNFAELAEMSRGTTDKSAASPPPPPPPPPTPEKISVTASVECAFQIQ
jgi:hypothetical protein